MGDCPRVTVGEIEPVEDLPDSQYGALGALRRDGREIWTSRGLVSGRLVDDVVALGATLEEQSPQLVRQLPEPFSVSASTGGWIKVSGGTPA